jgi:hypothetical protein
MTGRIIIVTADLGSAFACGPHTPNRKPEALPTAQPTQ